MPKHFPKKGNLTKFNLKRYATHSHSYYFSLISIDCLQISAILSIFRQGRSMHEIYISFISIYKNEAKFNIKNAYNFSNM